VQQVALSITSPPSTSCGRTTDVDPPSPFCVTVASWAREASSVPVAEIAALVAVAGFLLGLISLALHWVRRAEHPYLAPIQREMAELRLSHADIVERLEAFLNRDRVRRSRDKALQTAQESAGAAIDPPPATTPTPPSGDELKQALRRAARAQGVLR
jgi:hypothetical protein